MKNFLCFNLLMLMLISSTSMAAEGICNRSLVVRNAILEDVGLKICGDEAHRLRQVTGLPQVTDWGCEQGKRVTCEQVTKKELERVVEMSIRGGESPSLLSGDFDGLSNLKRFKIIDTPLVQSDIPIDQLHKESPNLENIELRGNRFGKDGDGTLSTDWGKFSELRLFEVADNGLKGPLPSALGNLSKLQVLKINEPQITGPVPESFRNLTNLRNLGRNLSHPTNDLYTFFLKGDREKECRLFPQNGHREIIKQTAHQLINSTSIIDISVMSVSSSIMLDEKFTHFSIHEDIYESKNRKRNNLLRFGTFVGGLSSLGIPVVGPFISLGVFITGGLVIDNRQENLALTIERQPRNRRPLPSVYNVNPTANSTNVLPLYIYDDETVPFFNNLNITQDWNEAKVHYRFIVNNPDKSGTNVIHVNCKIRYRHHRFSSRGQGASPRDIGGEMEVTNCSSSDYEKEVMTISRNQTSTTDFKISSQYISPRPSSIGEESSDECAILKRQQQANLNINDSDRSIPNTNEETTSQEEEEGRQVHER